MRVKGNGTYVWVLLLVLTMASCTQGPPKKLIGTWQDQKYTNNQLVFTEDHEFYETYLGETISNGTYEVGEGTLDMQWLTKCSGDCLFTVHYSISGDILTIIDDYNTMTFQKVFSP